ncbi:MAG: YciI family protein [Myxococcota bacterium]
MRYTFLLYSEEKSFEGQSPEDKAQQLQVFGQYIAGLRKAGHLVNTDWLQPTAAATTVSLAGGKRLVQDGPFAATKEQLGGYFVVDMPDLDAAIAWAEKCPLAHFGKIEVRPSAMPEGGNPHAAPKDS